MLIVALLSSFASYTLEKKISRHLEQFRKGAIEGVAGPESANNAGAQTSFITKPISAGFIIASVILLVIVALPAIRKKREEAFQEAE